MKTNTYQPIPAAGRLSGVLCHLSSLPGGLFHGDLGCGQQFIQFLLAAGQSAWQMLPLNPIGFGDNPYSSHSLFAIEPLFIDIQELVHRGWLDEQELAAASATESLTHVADFAQSRVIRYTLLEKAHKRFQGHMNEDYLEFCDREKAWLFPYVTFEILAQQMGHRYWPKWTHGFHHFRPELIDHVKSDASDRFDFYCFLQYLADRQLRHLAQSCRDRKITLIGDLPFYPSFDSADCWAHADCFLLDDKLERRYFSGIAPEKFFPQGEIWRHAVYDWDTIKDQDYKMLFNRMQRMLDFFDVVRLDHFNGYFRSWKIPADSDDAASGKWHQGPGEGFLKKLLNEYGSSRFIAEDLGVKAKDIDDSRENLGLYCTRVATYGFNPGTERHKTYFHPSHTVFYTTIHDSDTAKGWFQSTLTENTSNAAIATTFFGDNPFTIHYETIRYVMSSRAPLAMIAMQDLLGLGSEGRMNKPGVTRGNWSWRFSSSDLSRQLATSLRTLTEHYDRVHS